MKAKKDQKPDQQYAAIHRVQKEPGDGGTATLKDNRPGTVIQRKLLETMNGHAAGKELPVQRKENKTGMPDNLKTGIENLSGYSMDDVKVHYNSSKPAQLQAHAYAQGTNIHLASGQEKHLPHEAWHVVQQKQGRVQPTAQLKGKVAINDDAGLEKEADIMGEKAVNLRGAGQNMARGTEGVVGPVENETGERKEHNPRNEGEARVVQRKSYRMSGILSTLHRILGFDWNANNENEAGPEDIRITNATITKDIGGNQCVFNCQTVRVHITKDANGRDHVTLEIATMNTGGEMRIGPETIVDMNLTGITVDLVDPSLLIGALKSFFSHLYNLWEVAPATIQKARSSFASTGSVIQINHGDIWVYGNWFNPKQNTHPNSDKREREVQQIIINDSKVEVIGDANNVVELSLRRGGENNQPIKHRNYRNQKGTVRGGTVQAGARPSRQDTTEIIDPGIVRLEVNTSATNRGVRGWRINGTKIRLKGHVTLTIQNSPVNNMGTGNLTVLVRGIPLNNTLTVSMTQWIITAAEIKRAIRQGIRGGFMIDWPMINWMAGITDVDLSAIAGVGDTTATYV
ncbi:MAG: DUF4157 domain-containing protein [Bacteroidota bacterium]